jgi:hypothetical protein
MVDISLTSYQVAQWQEKAFTVSKPTSAKLWRDDHLTWSASVRTGITKILTRLAPIGSVQTESAKIRGVLLRPDNNT